MTASLFSQPPVAYFRPLPSSVPHTRTPSFIACGTQQEVVGGSSLTEFETISSKVCDWAGELGKDHDLRQSADNCAWLFAEQAAPFEVIRELPSSSLFPAAQGQPRVDFVSSASAVKSLFWAACEEESDVGLTVHRLGDWLVIDDGAEISACLGAGQPSRGTGQPCGASSCYVCAEEFTGDEAYRVAEQRHRAAVARAEVVEARAAEMQQRLEQARAALWQAEREAQRAQEDLREALDEVDRAVDECHMLRGVKGEMASADIESSNSPGFVDDEVDRDRLDKDLRAEGADPGTTADPQLYKNFLGHSIRLLRDATACDGPLEPSGAAPKATHGGEDLIALDGSAPFRQVGVWKVADDASVVVGSNMVCLGNAEHPKLALYLHDSNVVSDMVLLEHWLECLIAGVPEFAICFHRDGAVQSYRLYKLSELWSSLEERLAIGRKLQMMLEVLRWIKRQCCFEGCTYWLSKAKDEPTIKLFQLSGGASGAGARKKSCKAITPVQTSMPAPVNLSKELVLKNTFLTLLEDEEADQQSRADKRRTQSCPARVFGPLTVEDAAGERDITQQRSELSLRSGEPQPWKAFQHRIAALFFRRAVSSPPGTDAMRFFEHALDLAAESGVNGPDGMEEGSFPFLRACCHLGLAACEMVACSSQNGTGDLPASAASSEEQQNDSASLGATAALLDALLGEAPRRDHSRAASAKEGNRSYWLWPMCGLTRRAPLLFVGVPPWPGNHRRAAASEIQHQDEDNADSVFPASSSSSSTQSAMVHLADAFAVLSSSDGSRDGCLPDCDSARVEALAFPIAALALLRLSSELIRQSIQSHRRVCRLVATRLAWRALRMARQFAVLGLAHQVSEQRPVFSKLPSSEELLVRIEYLSGGLLLVCPLSSPTELTNAMLDDSMTSVRMEAPRLHSAIAKLEDWLEKHDVRVTEAVAGVAAQRGLPSLLPPIDLLDVDPRPGDAKTTLVDSLTAFRLRRREAAVWHYEQSIRLLPKSMHRECSLLHHMMMALTVSLVESAASLAETVNACAADTTEASSECFESLCRCDNILSRAEELAEAARRQAVCAIVQASRAHLRSLAADILVGRALNSRSGNTSQPKDLYERRLDMQERKHLDDLLGDSDEEDSDTDGVGGTIYSLADYVGRLGDEALTLSSQAQQSVDRVIEADAAAALAVMHGGTLQAAAARLWALPPPSVSDVELRRAMSSMLAQSSQALSHVCSGGASSVESCVAVHASHLQVNAHLMQSEGPGSDRSQQRQLRTSAWHVDKAGTTLHGAADLGPATTVLLVHLHLARADAYLQSSCAGASTAAGASGGASSASASGHASKRLRQCERALGEILAASRAIGCSPTACIADDPACGKTLGARGLLPASRQGPALPSVDVQEFMAFRVAENEVRYLLLDRLRALLRELCAIDIKDAEKECKTLGRAGWKEFYRAALQLKPECIATAPVVYEGLKRKTAD